MNLFSPIFAKVFGALSIALALGLTVQTLRANHFHADRDRWHAAFDAQKAAYEAAQQEATAKAIAAKLATEARYRAEAEKTDNEYQTALARAQRASDAYAARMRAKASGGAPGRTPSPAPRDGPESPDRPCADAVVVTRDDFDILVENSVRLEAAHEWAKTLNMDTRLSP